jgi:hypothetical protein
MRDGPMSKGSLNNRQGKGNTGAGLALATWHALPQYPYKLMCSFVDAFSLRFSLTSITRMAQAHAIEHSAKAAEAPKPMA